MCLKTAGPSCSKLMTSLVNDSSKFTSSDTQICWNFLPKKTHLFSAKNIRILCTCIESAKIVNELTLNKLVKLTMLWTTGPWMSGKQCRPFYVGQQQHYAASDQSLHCLLRPVSPKTSGYYSTPYLCSTTAALCSIWSESTLFTQACQSQNLGLLQYSLSVSLSLHPETQSHRTKKYP